MKRTIILTLLLCMAVTASAQFGRSGPERQPFARGAYGRGEFGDAWSPRNILGLILDLDADYGVTTEGGAMSAWLDQSIYGNDAAQGTGANRLTHVLDQLNGHAVARSSAQNKYMDVGAPDGLIDPTKFTVFVVASSPDVNGTSTAYPLGIGGRTSISVGGSVFHSKFTTLDAGAATLEGGVLTDDTPFLGTWLNDGTNVLLRQNGVQTLAPTAMAQSITDIRINNRQNSGVLGMVGDLSKLLLYNRTLSTPEIELVEDWLKERYLLY